jgi:hypothetical protein
MTVFIKPSITPEQLQNQKKLFNYTIYGFLKFYFVISYKKSNIFFSFYCKSQNFSSQVFLFYKQSLGLEQRDDIREGKAPVVGLRGRRKNQFYHIKLKFNMAKAYIYEFIKCHSEMIDYNNLHVVWKMQKFDMHINNLLNIPFNIDFNFNSENTNTNTNTNTTVPEPQIIHYFYLKFPHNGCRPKKVRRLKKRRRR